MLTGHDHFYERTKPQNGIVYFVVGVGGKLREGNIDPRSALTAQAASTTDLSFMAVGDLGRRDVLQRHLASRERLSTRE